MGTRIVYTCSYKASMAILISDKIDFYKKCNGSETRKNKSVHVAHINNRFSVQYLQLIAFEEQEPILTGKWNDV